MTKAQADFVGCLMNAVLAALPVFLQSLMGCLAGGNNPGQHDEYKPGARPRCNE